MRAQPQLSISWLRELSRGHRNRELRDLARRNKLNVFDLRRKLHKLLQDYDRGIRV